MQSVHHFLGTARIRRLFDELSAQPEIDRNFGAPKIAAAVLVGLLPLLMLLADALHATPLVDPATALVAASSLIAVLLRLRWELPRPSIKALRQQLSHTHVAFALGCLPAVLFIYFSPELLTEKQETISRGLSSAPEMQLWVSFFLAFAIAGFAAVCEEFTYRGLVLSSLRRARLFKSQKAADTFAVLVSSLIFAVAHFPAWGATASIALFFISLGLSVGYVVAKENVVPLILYHWLFNFLSISVLIVSPLLLGTSA